MDVFGLFGIVGFMEYVLRMCTYIAVICVSIKGVKALDIYLDKNSR